jgi:hypothetical protein
LIERPKPVGAASCRPVSRNTYLQEGKRYAPARKRAPRTSADRSPRAVPRSGITESGTEKERIQILPELIREVQKPERRKE